MPRAGIVLTSGTAKSLPNPAAARELRTFAQNRRGVAVEEEECPKGETESVSPQPSRCRTCVFLAPLSGALHTSRFALRAYLAAIPTPRRYEPASPPGLLVSPPGRLHE